MTASHSRSLLLLCSLGLASCGTTPIPALETNPSEPMSPSGPTAPATPTEPTTPAEPVAAASHAFGCDDPSSEWFAEQDNWWIDSAWLGVVAEGRFVSHTHHATRMSQVLRGRDGAATGSLQGSPHDAFGYVLDYSAVQDRVAYWRGDFLVVADTRSGEILREEETVEGPQHAHRVELSPDGAWLATVRCAESSDGLEVAAFELEGDRSWHWTVDSSGSSTCPNWASHNAIELDIARGHLAVVEPLTGVVWLHSLEDGTARAIDAHSPFDTGQHGWHEAHPTLDVALSPDGSELATSGSDQLVRRWRTSDLALLDERASHWVMLNLMTYTTPFAASPVTYSHDGRWLAYVNDEGDVGLADTRTGQTTVVADRRSSEPAEHWEIDGRDWGIAGLAFAPDDRSLVILETGGTQLFGCERSLSEPELAPVVRLNTTREARVGERWTFELEVNSPEPRVAVSWALDDSALSPYLITSDQGWTFYEPGEHRVRFVADDGFHLVEREVVITVLE